MGNGADVSNKTTSRKPDPLRPERPKVSGAMAQQCGDSGPYSAPQELLRLVGCRETKVAPGSKVRRDPNQVQR
jgi:hypothetical protein